MTWLFWTMLAGLSITTILWIMAPVPKLEIPARIQGKVSYIVDGDSLFLEGVKSSIRLWGVDAPETSESGFAAATDYLFLIAQGQRITCDQIETDRFGRVVARCFLSDGREINRMMIESGKAKEYRRFTKGFYSRRKL